MIDASFDCPDTLGIVRFQEESRGLSCMVVGGTDLALSNSRTCAPTTMHEQPPSFWPAAAVLVPLATLVYDS